MKFSSVVIGCVLTTTGILLSWKLSKVPIKTGRVLDDKVHDVEGGARLLGDGVVQEALRVFLHNISIKKNRSLKYVVFEHSLRVPGRRFYRNRTYCCIFFPPDIWTENIILKAWCCSLLNVNMHKAWLVEQLLLWEIFYEILFSFHLNQYQTDS